jgi:putative copper export protein/mono/diheme cytochrome c family protein
LSDPLVLVRAVHFIATMSAVGAVFFAAFVAAPALPKASAELVTKVQLQLTRMVWVSLALVFISAIALLILTTADISDRTLAAVFSDNVLWTVLAQTGFGHGWLARIVLAGLLAGLLLALPLAKQTDAYRMAAAVVAAALVAMLAWAGHAIGTPGIDGDVHLLADIFHLLAAAMWVGMLLPLALLLRAARDRQESLGLAQAAVQRFSTLGVASVAAILVTGIVNTWFLAGSVPALVGTDYGRLLLVKVALFLVMVAIAAINRFRLRPRLANEPSGDALPQLQHNSVVEAIAGMVILMIVAKLGRMPPGLHEQPIWPFSFRIPSVVFGETDFYVSILFGAAWIAAGVFVRRFRWPAIAVGAAIYGLLAIRLPIIEAYPTTFYGSPTGFSVESIAAGEGLFAAHCAACHGAEGRGDGPAGAPLKTTPADLTADHVYAHTDGELLWWITHGISPDMPPFGDVLTEEARWNVIDFIRANADATRLRALGAGTTAAFPAPDFSAQCADGSTVSLAGLRPQIVHIVIAGRDSGEWLRQVAERDVAAKLKTIVIASDSDIVKGSPLCVSREPESLRTFAHYRGTEPIEGSEFLVDPAGNLRSMWRADDSTRGQEANALAQRVRGLRVAARVQRPSGAQGHTHTH